MCCSAAEPLMETVEPLVAKFAALGYVGCRADLKVIEWASVSIFTLVQSLNIIYIIFQGDFFQNKIKNVQKPETQHTLGIVLDKIRDTKHLRLSCHKIQQVFTPESDLASSWCNLTLRWVVLLIFHLNPSKRDTLEIIFRSHVCQSYQSILRHSWYYSNAVMCCAKLERQPTDMEVCIWKIFVDFIFSKFQRHRISKPDLNWSWSSVNNFKNPSELQIAVNVLLRGDLKFGRIFKIVHKTPASI